MKIKLKILFLILSLLAVNCSDYDPNFESIIAIDTNNISIFPSLVEKEPILANAVFQAADIWCKSNLPNLRYGGSTCTNVSIGTMSTVKVKLFDGTIILKDGREAIGQNKCEPVGCEIRFSTKFILIPVKWHYNTECKNTNDSYNAIALDIAMHELGHLMGYAHDNNNKHNVMNEVGNQCAIRYIMPDGSDWTKLL